MEKVYNWFLKSYENSSLELRKKARILLTTIIVLTCLLLTLGIVMLATGAFFVSMVLFIVNGLCILTLFAIRWGKYKVAVNIFFYLSVTAVFCAIKFDQYVSVYETYVIGTLGSFLIIVTSLIGYDKRQPLLMSVFVCAFILLLDFMDILPAEKWQVSVLHIQNLVTCFLMLLFSGIYGMVTISLQKELVKDAELEADKNSKRFQVLDHAVKSAQQTNLDIGSRLSISTSQALKVVKQVRDTLTVVKKEVDDLNSSVRISSDANEKIGGAAGQVKESMENYRSAVEQVSRSVQAIVSSINGISANTKDKKGELDQLVAISSEGRDKMNLSRESINKVSSSSSDILNMVNVINEVANRTNMLALNASIEASHAGEAGKGFSVVASEIRKLSSETNRSSKLIIDNVKTSINDIRDSASIINNLQQVFEQINIEIRTVAELLQNIIWDVNQVSGGTSEILKVLEGIDRISVTVNQAMEHVTKMIENSSRGIEGVNFQTGRILSDIGTMVDAFETMIRETENVDRLGRENIDSISRFYDSVRNIEN